MIVVPRDKVADESELGKRRDQHVALFNGRLNGADGFSDADGLMIASSLSLSLS